MPIFVIHHHFASHEHFDLRLEMDNVLRSWAVPKEPPRKTGIKRLAVQVSDHAVSYAKFKGTIPKGNYGAGKVEIWDKGTYKVLEQDKKKIVFELKGKRLKGMYVLVNFRERNWLLFKKKV